MSIKYMNVEEFIDQGYLHEVNRQFLHPLGLALVVGCDTDDDTGEQVGPWRLTGIWDNRDDPEGIAFADETLDPEKARKVQDELTRRVKEELAWRSPAREKALGYVVQPIPEE